MFVNVSYEVNYRFRPHGEVRQTRVYDLRNIRGFPHDKTLEDTEREI